MQNELLTNDKILLAAGVDMETITAIKTASVETAINLMDPVFERVAAYVQTMRTDVARLENPLGSLEKGYAALNGGKLNGLFREILIPTRAKGDNNLYGGVKRINKKTAVNPWNNSEFGEPPYVFTYGINASVERHLNYDRYDMLMMLKENALMEFINGKLATIEEEDKATRYIIENAVLNCDRFQNLPYSSDEEDGAAPQFHSADELNAYMYKVFSTQRFPESNVQFKRIPFNTTRKSFDSLVLILDSEFAFDFAQHYQLKQFLKPFMFRSEDGGVTDYGMKTEEQISKIIEVDKLTPTTIEDNAVLDPLNLTPANIPNGGKLIGRIVDFNAVKFGLGMKTGISIPKDSRITFYTQADDYVFDMCPAYVNVPLIIASDFDSNRKFHIVNDTPTEE